MNERLESKGNSRAAAKLEGPSRQSWSWKAVEDETEKFSPSWHDAARRGATWHDGNVGSILPHYVKFDLDFDVACSPGNSESFAAKSLRWREGRKRNGAIEVGAITDVTKSTSARFHFHRTFNPVTLIPMYKCCMHYICCQESSTSYLPLTD